MDIKARLRSIMRITIITIAFIVLELLVIVLAIRSCVNELPVSITYKDVRIGIQIPEDSQALEESEEGCTYYGKIKLSAQGISTFLSKAKDNADWKEMPLPKDIARISVLPDGFPTAIRNGIYSFHDFYAEEHTEVKNIDINERGEYIFEIAVLDLNTGILYIFLYI